MTGSNSGTHWVFEKVVCMAFARLLGGECSGKVVTKLARV